jgi:hypothetical protein
MGKKKTNEVQNTQELPINLDEISKESSCNQSESDVDLSGEQIIETDSELMQGIQRTDQKGWVYIGQKNADPGRVDLVKKITVSPSTL